MRILLINKFFFLKGGAETLFFKMAKLLRENGHEVLFFSMEHPQNYKSPYSKYFVSHVDFEKPKNIVRKIFIVERVLYALEARIKIAKLIKLEKPDIAHLHNVYHHISPSILHVIKRYNIPVVLTLHDYKMVCPVYTLLDRRGNICEKCKDGRYYWCLLKKCNKGSFIRSLLNVIEMYLHHKILCLFDLVDLFISPSRFLKEKFNELGFQKEIVHLPNFIEANEYTPSFFSQDDSVVYFGRLSREKGLFTLISAMKGLDIKCKIIGDGPLRAKIIEKINKEKLNNFIFYGYLSGEELKNEIKKSAIAILPSEWYENFPYMILEAFALGKPVIGSKIGGIPELVIDDQTGLTFPPKNWSELRRKVLSMFKNREKIFEMGRNGRKLVEQLNPYEYYKKLINIYKRLL